MSTWDTMSDADYAACVDAGRGMPADPRETADEERRAAKESGTWVAAVESRDSRWDRWAREHHGVDHWEQLEPGEVAAMRAWSDADEMTLP